METKEKELGREIVEHLEYIARTPDGTVEQQGYRTRLQELALEYKSVTGDWFRTSV